MDKCIVACLLLCIGCGDEGFIYTRDIEPRRFSKSEVLENVSEVAPRFIASVATHVNQWDHPWLASLLLSDLKRKLESGDIARARGVAEAVVWVCWKDIETVRHEVRELLASDFPHLEVVVGILRYIGEARDDALLEALFYSQSDAMRDAAREARRALFGDIEANSSDAEAALVSENDAWLMSRIARMRSWVLSKEERMARVKSREELYYVSDDGLNRLMKLLLRSMSLPLEQYASPGRLSSPSKKSILPDS